MKTFRSLRSHHYGAIFAWGYVLALTFPWHWVLR